MIIFPLLYLFWWKKRWRLLLGIIILVVLAIGCLFPSEFTYSLLTSETDKEEPLQKLQTALENISDAEPNPADPEKLKLEKSIIKSQKKINNFLEKERRGEKPTDEEEWEIRMEGQLLRQLMRPEWIRKWGRKEKSPTFLFCGEHFNEELSREGAKWERKWRKVESYNIIDFGQKENNNPTLLKKKLQEICEQKQNWVSLKDGFSPIVWLKNIDKITNSELKNELLKIVDPDKKMDLGKYWKEIKEGNETKNIEKTIDLSQFILVATTSTSNPQLSKELQAKLKHVESFFDKYFWVLFFSSLGVEIVIFFLLIRARKKEKKKTLKQFDY